ncbi:MAG: hypothetical protein H0Z34_11685 [Brevibacillus sp.]|nr:hypothetical protein [Brevibacillus sp.]
MRNWLKSLLAGQVVLALLSAMLAMPAALVSAMPDQGGNPSVGHGQKAGNSYRLNLAHSPAVQKLLKLDHQALREELRRDKSLAEIAEERGVSLEALTEAVCKERSERLDRAVAEGRLSADDAKVMKQKQANGIKKRLMAKRSDHKLYKRNRLEKLANLLKMTPDELNRQLQSGKSLAEVAAERNVPTEQVKQVMRTSLLQMIDQKVEDGLIPPSKADKWKQKVEGHLERMLEARRMSHKHAG